MVGAGIGGAVFALGLARHGRRAVVLERQVRTVRVSRPEGLWNRTLDRLDPLGVGSLVREQAALRIRGFEGRLGQRLLLTISEDDLAAAGAAMYSTDPDDVRRLILDVAAATGNVTVLRGTEVTDLLWEGGRVVGVRARQGEASVELRADLVVGDDGAHSIVRGALGIPILLRTFPLELVTFEFPRPASAPGDRFLAWVNPQGLSGGLVVAGFVPAPKGMVKGVLALPLGLWDARFHRSGDTFWHTLAALTPLADDVSQAVKFPDGFTVIRRPYGHAAAYTRNGAAIIGDAAHPMSPVGGQGANCAIWDGLALANVFLAVTEDSGVDAYERRRYGANARSVALTAWGASAIRLGRRLPVLSGVLSMVAPAVARSPRVKRVVLSRVARAFVSD